MPPKVQMEKIFAGDYRGPAVITFLFEGDQKLTPDQGSIDRRYKGILAATLKSGQFRAERFETYPVSLLGQKGLKRLQLVGLGKKEDFEIRHLRRAVAAGVLALRAQGISEMASTFLDPEEKLCSIQVQAEVLTTGALIGGYQFDPYKTEKKPRPAELAEFTLLSKDLPPIPIRNGIKWGETVGTSTNYARTLGNHLANVANPEFLAREAMEMAKRFNTMRCKVLEREDVVKLGMGALLAVNQGSADHHPLKLIMVEIRGRSEGRSSARGRNKRRPRIGLVGKGITFDSGGLNLKTTSSIASMKYDMCGAAAVLGILRGLAEAALPVDVVALIPATENMPGKTAYRPGDILKTMSGKTIEVGNTDAEGRLILCDTLTYMQQQKVDAMIDFATLTGAVMVALGDEASGLFCNNDALATQIETAGKVTGERVWRFPLWPEYNEKLKSNVADTNNIGGPYGGAITAACFLQKFVEKTPWAHIDIAGTAHFDEKKTGWSTGATGVGVSLVLEMLRKYKSV